MAQKKATEEQPDGALVAAAKTIGATAGKIAAAVGLTTTPKADVLKPAKKRRLPRRQKKAVKKAAKPANG
jgi:hypothetical protein